MAESVECATDIPEYYFDLNQGVLLTDSCDAIRSYGEGERPALLRQLHKIGRLVIDSSAEYAAQHSGGQIRRLGELILDTTVDLPTGAYPVFPFEIVDTWKPDDYIAYGKWAQYLISEVDRDARFTRNKAIRLYNLGLGPNEQRIAAPTRFITWANFYKELELDHTVRRGIYNNMTLTECLEYVKETAAALEQNPSDRNWVKAFNQRAAQGEGPSHKVLLTVTGHNLSQLLEIVGYPDVQSWRNPDKFAIWGAKFMLANNGTEPGVNALYALAKRRRGPGCSTVYKYFDNISDFKHSSKEQYMARIDELNHRIAGFYEQLRGQDVVRSALRQHNLSPMLRVRIGAQAALLQAVSLPISPDFAQTLATLRNPQTLVNSITSKRILTTEDMLHETARQLGLHDDIWPMDDYMKNLKISA